MSLHPLLRRHWPLALAAAAPLLVLLWAMLAPVRGPSHEQLLDMRGGPNAPTSVRLTLGVQDVLLVRNLGAAPLVFGPVQLAPGGEFRFPVEATGEQDIPCPALPGGVLRVRVVPLPDPGWDRLRWRLDNLSHAIRTMPLQGPE